jgi:hypothetical protein
MSKKIELLRMWGVYLIQLAQDSVFCLALLNLILNHSIQAMTGNFGIRLESHIITRFYVHVFALITTSKMFEVSLNRPLPPQNNSCEYYLVYNKILLSIHRGNRCQLLESLMFVESLLTLCEVSAAKMCSKIILVLTRCPLHAQFLICYCFTCVCANLICTLELWKQDIKNNLWPS